MPEPSATGSFVKTPLSHLLVYAHDRELTGTFELTGPAGESATVLFIDGLPTKARTPAAEVYLGQVLFELGILSKEQLEALLPRLLAGSELHGQVLMAEGLLTEEQLELGLRAQLVRQMKWLVHLPSDTTYAYYDAFDGLASYGGDGHVGIDPYPIVWSGIRDEPPWEHVHLGLTGLGTARIRLIADAETARFSFDKAERSTVELLRREPLRVYDLVQAETMAPRIVQLLVYCLLVTKQVEVVAEARATRAPVDEPPPSAPSSAPSSSRPTPMGSPEGAPGLTTQTVARVQLAQRPLVRPSVAIETELSTERMTPQGEGGSTSYVATQPRTKKRSTLTSEGAPAAASEPAVAGDGSAAAGAGRDSPAVAPVLAVAGEANAYQIATPAVGMAAINELAMSTWSQERAAAVPSGPQELPTVPRMAAVGAAEIAAAAEAQALSPRPVEPKPPSSGARPLPARPPPPLPTRAPPAATAPTAATAPPAGRPAPSPESKRDPISVKPEDDAKNAPSLAPGAPPSHPSPMTAELIARKKEIQDRAASLEKTDYFTLLGVARDTPSAEIQKAFFTLAKKWHPDRVPPPLADVKDLCAKVFGRMSEAHQTLMDAGRRAKYEASMKSGSDDSPEAQAQVLAILGAATDFQKAEICLKRNDVKQAEEFCTKAITVEPKQADYIAMMAWLQSLKPTKQDPASTQAQVTELTRAIGISQACERAFFYRAMLLKRLGQESQAVKDFKRAMELNPRNVDAQREVRLYNMRGGDKGKPSNAPSAKKDDGGGIFGRLFKK